MTKREREQNEARDELRKFIAPGDTIHTVLRHRSRSGMYRAIDLFWLKPDERERGRIDKRWLSRLAARACGFRFDERREAVGASGCGMDMGFHLVYSLSSILFRDGFGCIGEGCPSNDHSNGDRDYTPHATYLHDKAQHAKLGKPPSIEPHWHRDGGYALRHEWL